jgi:hypothetical protein
MKNKTKRYLDRLRKRLDDEYLAMRNLHFGNFLAWGIAMRAAGHKFPKKSLRK